MTDGTDSFFGSRTFFQVLHDHGDFSAITAFGSSTSESKKMLISRQARYSGLLDKLSFAEGSVSGPEFATALEGASTLVVVNADEAAIAAQVAAAKQAGVKRALVHLNAGDALADGGEGVQAALEGSGLTYTIVRTGSLGKGGGGGGLFVSDLDTPTCDELPIDDVYRFLVEALSIAESEGRAISLCPSADDTQVCHTRSPLFRASLARLALLSRASLTRHTRC